VTVNIFTIFYSRFIPVLFAFLLFFVCHSKFLPNFDRFLIPLKMKKLFLIVFAMWCGMAALQARPIDVEQAKEVGLKFVCANFDNTRQTNDLQLVYTGISDRSEVCFYAFNVGKEGFVIVSADDRFRPIVGYSDEGPFETENMSPELKFYLDKIIEARTSRNAVLEDNTAEEWQSVMSTGRLLSRNGGRGVDYLCTTKWNQDSPYNLYAPEASSGPGGRCYAGCVATAMSQVMKFWDYPAKGSGSHSYYCYGYGQLSANFGATDYDWDNMPDRLGGNSTQEEIEAVALLMYHCAVAVDMGFSPTGSGANSWDVPYAIRHYFSYSNQASLKGRDEYSLITWQNMLKESFDLGWPVYYSGFSDSGGHAFVCDGYDDDDLFHFNWGWGGSSDGWFVIDEIDYAGWAQAVFNFVPTNVYDYMPMQPENLEVNSLGDNDFSAELSWTNPTQDIHFNTLSSIDRIVVTRDGNVIYTEENAVPGASMNFTDHYMPTMVRYAVYAVSHDAKGLEAVEDHVQLGPTCLWSIEMTSSDEQGWDDGYLSLRNAAGIEISQLTANSSQTSQNLFMPFGHIRVYWSSPTSAIEQISFNLKDADGQSVVAFEGSSDDLRKGLFFVVNNTCGSDLNHHAPKNLSASRNDNDITLQWDTAEGDVNHYCIYRDQLLYDISETNTYTDSEASDVFHNYYVTALNDLGESDPSNICNAEAESACEAPSNLRYEMVNNKVKLTWDAPQDNAPTGYFVYRRTRGEVFKRIKAVTSTTYSDNFNAQPTEIYEYAVAAYFQTGDCTSALASSQDHPELNFITVNKTDIPQNLSFVHTGSAIVLNWETALIAESYNVYRNGELIAHDLTETTYADEDFPTQGICIYTVTGKTAFMESSPSNEAVVTDPTAISENSDEQEIKVYPNPTSGRVLVEGDNLMRISIFNLMGQELKHLEVQGTSSSLDLTDMPDGTYFIKVVSESGNNTIKIVKIQ
jgi:hypothetical protein